MVDITQLLQQAKEMQDKMQNKEKEMANRLFTGISGGDLVKVTCTGKGDIKNIDIDPSIINPNDKVLIQDLIIAAFAEAKKQAESAATSSIDNILNIIK